MKIKPLDESTALLQASGKEWCLLATSLQSRFSSPRRLRHARIISTPKELLMRTRSGASRLYNFFAKHSNISAKKCQIPPLT